MKFTLAIPTLIAAVSAVVSAAPMPQRGPVGLPPVFTATRVYQTIIDQPPYIVTRTTTMTWTQSPSTSIPFPTGTGMPPM